MSASISAATPRRRGRPPADQRDGDMRTLAINAAQVLLLEGSSALSMERLARSLGVRAPSLYYHFPGGRDEMVLAVADHYARIDGAAINAIMETGVSIPEKLESVASHFAGEARHHPYHMLTEQRKLLKPEARAELQRTFAEYVESPLIDLVQQGQADATLRRIDVQLCVRIFLTLVLRQGEFETTDAQRMALPRFMVDLLVEGMRERT